MGIIADRAQSNAILANKSTLLGCTESSEPSGSFGSKAATSKLTVRPGGGRESKTAENQRQLGCFILRIRRDRLVLGLFMVEHVAQPPLVHPWPHDLQR
jgi:hypothetical protein